MSGITNDKQLYKKAIKYNLKINNINYKDKLGHNVRDGNYIINLASSGNTGTHWVGLIIKGNTAYYFDSFGFAMPNEVRSFCKKKCSKIMYSNVQIQKLNSNYCGQYVIHFLYKMNQKGKPEDIYMNYIDSFNDVT
jgi:hypothetical protein